MVDSPSVGRLTVIFLEGVSIGVLGRLVIVELLGFFRRARVTVKVPR